MLTDFLTTKIICLLHALLEGEFCSGDWVVCESVVALSPLRPQLGCSPQLWPLDVDPTRRVPLSLVSAVATETPAQCKEQSWPGGERDVLGCWAGEVLLAKTLLSSSYASYNF